MLPLTPANFESAYANMIAGAIPLHSGDVDKTVFMMAQDVLGTSKMHLLIAVDAANAIVYYFAAPSAGFTSIPTFDTPLAAALPSHPQHQGDGIYFLKDINLSVAVEKNGDQVRLIANSPDVMDDWLTDHPEQPVYRVNSYDSWTMESIPAAYRRIANSISLRTARYSAIVGVLSLMVYVVASIGVAVLNASADKSNQSHMDAVNKAVSNIDFVAPLAQQVARMQRVSALVVRAGGWIEEYEVKNDNEKFVLMMPSWITKDYIDALGPKVEADQSTDENLIRVSLRSPLPGTTSVQRILTAKPTGSGTGTGSASTTTRGPAAP